MSGGGMLAKASLKKETFDLLNNGGGRVGMLTLVVVFLIMILNFENLDSIFC